jgi:hypothetical protein
MQQQNAVRKDGNNPVRTGLFLVHSRNWTAERRAREAAQLAQSQKQSQKQGQEQGREQIVRRGNRTLVQPRKGVSKLKRSLMTVTLCAPLWWAGHALLQWKHLL